MASLVHGHATQQTDQMDRGSKQQPTAVFTGCKPVEKQNRSTTKKEVNTCTSQTTTPNANSSHNRVSAGAERATRSNPKHRWHPTSPTTAATKTVATIASLQPTAPVAKTEPRCKAACTTVQNGLNSVAAGATEFHRNRC